MVRLICLFILFASLVSCSTGPLTQGEYSIDNVPEYSEDEGLVIVVRHSENYSGGMYGKHWIVSVDDKPVGDIFEGYYLPIAVKEGKRSLSVQVPLLGVSLYQPKLLSKKTIHLDVEAGNTYYAQLELAATWDDTSPIVQSVSFHPVPWNVAQTLLVHKTRLVGKNEPKKD